LADLLDVAGYYIDNVQLTYGTCALYGEGLLREKTAMLRQAHIDATPGGALLQVAIWQRRTGAFIQRAKHLGFTVMEVYDWTQKMSAKERSGVVRQCIDEGFRVITEVVLGAHAKDASDCEIAEAVRADLAAGAAHVIVPMYTKEGARVLQDPRSHDVRSSDILWEPPRGSEQQAHCEKLLMEIGVDANLIVRDPRDVLSVEALRVGLKDGPMAHAYARDPEWALPGTPG
jgi:phosphosulfolactate synthase (CoM biosynthesis protein A)